MSAVSPNTIFLRLEGPLQSWGDTSKFVIRRSMMAPTKSGMIGLICCAMGLSRNEARDRLPELNTLTMGVRVDRPGTRWWDYHTVGAGIGMTTAAGGLKTGAQGTLIKRLEYLADASFLVALQGDATLIEKIADALMSPKWQLYLGRKSCPPSLPVFAQPRKGADEKWTNPMAVDGDVKAALQDVPWCPRMENDLHADRRVQRDGPRQKWKIAVDIIREWRATDAKPTAPPEAEVWYDAPFSFDPPVHHPRLVERDQITVEVGNALQQPTPAPPRPRANYTNSEWTSEKLVEVVDEHSGEVTQVPFGARPRRLRQDHGLCVICKQQATTVQHITYRRAGGNETQSDLASLCRLCHDTMTMIEYGRGMGLDRIDPCDVRWRDEILRTRGEILRFRSEEGRRRALRGASEKVRKEMLEEDD